MERPSDGSETLVDKPSLVERICKDCDTSMIITITILSLIIITLILILIFGFLGDVDKDCSTVPPTEKDYICPIGNNFKFNADISDFFLDTALNETKWYDFGQTFLGSRNNFMFASNNVKVKDGCLRLTARKFKESENKPENYYRGFNTFATSIVKSIKKIKYGYFEIRAKTMNANVCNSFWLYDPHSDNLDVKFSKGNNSEEIDIFKLTGKFDYKKEKENYTRKYFNSVRNFKTPYVEATIVSEENDTNINKTGKTEFDFYSDFHTWGFYWGKDKLIWYLDGNITYQRDNDIFNRELHITFDSEILLDFFGEPDPNDLPAEFKIDYFKYWEESNESSRE